MLSGKPLDHVPKAGTSVAYTTTRAPGEIFIQLAVRAGRDTRLKWAAKGLLWELLTYHDGELPSDEDLYDAHRAAREAIGEKADGIDLLRGALDDLERRGYLVRLQIRDEHGHRRSVRALTDSPGHHKLAVQQVHADAQALIRKSERLAAERVLLKQEEFPRPAHCPPADSLGVTRDDQVVSLAERRARKAS